MRTAAGVPEPFWLPGPGLGAKREKWRCSGPRVHTCPTASSLCSRYSHPQCTGENLQPREVKGQAVGHLLASGSRVTPISSPPHQIPLHQEYLFLKSTPTTATITQNNTGCTRNCSSFCLSFLPLFVCLVLPSTHSKNEHFLCCGDCSRSGD